MVHFHVRLDVNTHDIDHTQRSAVDNVAAREAQLRAKRDGILQLAVGPQPGTLVVAGSVPQNRQRVAEVRQVRIRQVPNVTVEPEQVAEDDEMEDDHDDDDDDDEEEEEEERSDPEY
jgi:hypothetical protein